MDDVDVMFDFVLSTNILAPLRVKYYESIHVIVYALCFELLDTEEPNKTRIH